MIAISLALSSRYMSFRRQAGPCHRDRMAHQFGTSRISSHGTSHRESHALEPDVLLLRFHLAPVASTPGLQKVVAAGGNAAADAVKLGRLPAVASVTMMTRHCSIPVAVAEQHGAATTVFQTMCDKKLWYRRDQFDGWFAIGWLLRASHHTMSGHLTTMPTGLLAKHAAQVHTHAGDR